MDPLKNGQTGAVCRFKRRLGKTRGGWCFKMLKLSNSATHHSGQHFLKKYLRVDINFNFNYKPCSVYSTVRKVGVGQGNLMYIVAISGAMGQMNG